MTERLIKHKIKPQKLVIGIVPVLTIGVFANTVQPTFEIQDALAQGFPVTGSVILNQTRSITAN